MPKTDAIDPRDYKRCAECGALRKTRRIAESRGCPACGGNRFRPYFRVKWWEYPLLFFGII